jgi:hypothetical protein
MSVALDTGNAVGHDADLSCSNGALQLLAGGKSARIDVISPEADLRQHVGEEIAGGRIATSSVRMNGQIFR